MRVMAGPGSPRKLVRLRRRDRDAHAISYARASLSGIWRKEQERLGQSQEPEFSAVAVERCRRSLEHQDAAWDAMCADLGITALELWFEDALNNPAQTIADVCDYLSIDFDPKAAITVPTIEQQAQKGAHEWAEKLAGS
jgi:LPS sulfotransferase NodH